MLYDVKSHPSPLRGLVDGVLMRELLSEQLLLCRRLNPILVRNSFLPVLVEFPVAPLLLLRPEPLFSFFSISLSETASPSLEVNHYANKFYNTRKRS